MQVHEWHLQNFDASQAHMKISIHEGLGIENTKSPEKIKGVRVL